MTFVHREGSRDQAVPIPGQYPDVEDHEWNVPPAGILGAMSWALRRNQNWQRAPTAIRSAMMVTPMACSKAWNESVGFPRSTPLGEMAVGGSNPCRQVVVLERT